MNLLLGLVTVISWVNATSYVDGTPMPIEDISHIKLSYVKDGVESTRQVVLVPAPETTKTLSLIPGRWCFTARTVTVQEEESDPTEAICHRVTGKPNAPTTVVIVFGR
jgi:hypothetical protein